MAPRPVPLRMYDQTSTADPLPWDWVEERLVASGTYWVTAIADGPFPHPRPVWGVWLDEELMLSVGSPVVLRALDANPEVTVHLESGTDVVIVEGTVSAGRVDDATIERFLAEYEPKYDYDYDVGEFGPPRVVRPMRVLAWRAAGPAGREGFAQVGKWVLD